MREMNTEEFEYKGNSFTAKIDRHYNQNQYALIIDMKLDNPEGFLEFPNMTANGIEVEASNFYNFREKIAVELRKCRKFVVDDKFMWNYSYGNERLRNSDFPMIEKVIVPENSKHYATNESGTMLLSKDKKKLVQIFAEGLKSKAVIPAYVNYICDHAFENSKCCEIDFPKNVKFQSQKAYADCTRMRSDESSLVISKGTLLGFNRELEYLDLPDEVTSYEKSVFKTYNRIRKIKTHIPLTKAMLSQVDKLSEYILTRPIKKLDSSMLSENKYLERVIICDDDPKYKSVDGVVYSKDGTRLIYYPQGKKDSLYVIQEGTRLIMPDSFAHNKYIEKVMMPDTVEQIGVGAFCDSSLKEVQLSAGLKEIPDWNMYNAGGSFMGCKIKNIRIPRSVCYIGRCAFLDCGLEHVVFEEGSSLETIGSYAFAENMIKSISLPQSLQRVSMGALRKIEQIDAFEGSAKGLISAVSAIPFYENTKAGNMEWGRFEINCSMKNGNKEKIIIPASVKKTSAYMYDNAWNGDTFDFDAYDEAFEDVSSADEKLAITTERIKAVSGKEIYEAYMKTASLKIATELLRNGKEKEFLEFLDKDYLSVASVKKLCDLANEYNMITVSAYIMDKIGKVNDGKKRKGSRFSL